MGEGPFFVGAGTPRGGGETSPFVLRVGSFLVREAGLGGRERSVCAGGLAPDWLFLCSARWAEEILLSFFFYWVGGVERKFFLLFRSPPLNSRKGETII